MAKQVELFVTENPPSAIWKLPPPSEAGEYLLIGWRVYPEPVDGGVPPMVAEVLAGALCNCATVSFLSDDFQRPRFTLFSTLDPRVAIALFDDAAYPWTQHGQLALLSGKDTPPPDLTAKQIRALTEHRNPDAAKQAGFTGMLLPGVDGDVAGLWIFDPAAKRQFMKALLRGCEAAGYPLSTTTEDEFRESLRCPGA
jgi:hypothetical protein